MVSLFKVPHSNNCSLINDVLISDDIIAGEYCNKMQEFVSTEFGGVECVLTKDMSTALFALIKLLDVDTPVMMNTFNCLSSTSPVANLGKKIIWTHWDIESGYDYPLLEEQIDTFGVKVFIHYHVAGYVTDMDELQSFCKRKSTILIEDCNNSISGYFQSKKIGTFGDFTILSFYANRYLSTCDGGAIVINNRDLMDVTKLKSFLKYGIDLEAFRLANGEINSKSDVSSVGVNGHLSNLNCVVGTSQLSALTNKKNIINGNFHTYENLISDEFKINVRHDVKIYPWVYLIKIKKNANKALAYLKDSGVQCSYLHFFNHHYSGFESCNVVNLDERNIIALPVGWWVNGSDIVKISTVVNQIKE